PRWRGRGVGSSPRRDGARDTRAYDPGSALRPVVIRGWVAPTTDFRPSSLPVPGAMGEAALAGARGGLVPSA
ncbi:hypothetical protein PV392_13950, partial [Streptomyces sp. ME03-5709C]|nr:hypothetical protein [Streptomyces sp. ME03-5709C]